MDKKEKRNQPMMLASFVTCISISLVAITLGGLLIFASYEVPLMEGIEEQNNTKMMYFTCLAIGSLFIVAGALLAWISVKLIFKRK